MDRTLFGEEHELFRKSFQAFLARDVLPNQERWREAGVVDRDAWKKAGAAGFLCPWLEPELGGAGGDFLHSVVIMEEMAKAHDDGFATSSSRTSTPSGTTRRRSAGSPAAPAASSSRRSR